MNAPAPANTLFNPDAKTTLPTPLTIKPPVVEIVLFTLIVPAPVKVRSTAEPETEFDPEVGFKVSVDPLLAPIDADDPRVITLVIVLLPAVLINAPVESTPDPFKVNGVANEMLPDIDNVPLLLTVTPELVPKFDVVLIASAPSLIVVTPE